MQVIFNYITQVNTVPIIYIIKKGKYPIVFILDADSFYNLESNISWPYATSMMQVKMKVMTYYNVITLKC